jgi:hypothetical protein
MITSDKSPVLHSGRVFPRKADVNAFVEIPCYNSSMKPRNGRVTMTIKQWDEMTYVEKLESLREDIHQLAGRIAQFQAQAPKEVPAPEEPSES